MKIGLSNNYSAQKHQNQVQKQNFRGLFGASFEDSSSDRTLDVIYNYTVHPYYPFKNETKDEIKLETSSMYSSSHAPLKKDETSYVSTTHARVEETLPFTKEEFNLFKTAKESLVAHKIEEIAKKLQELNIRI